MSKETSNAREGDSTEGCRQGVGRDPAHPDAGVGGNPSGLSTPIAAGGGEDADAAEDARLHPNAPDKPSSSDLVERDRRIQEVANDIAGAVDAIQANEKAYRDLWQLNEEQTEHLKSEVQRLEAERAEAYEKGRESAFEEIGNYYLMRKDCQDALAKAQATITALQSERDRLREALEKIAAYDDTGAEANLKATGSYSSFDEPGSVQRARAALAGKD
jgi:chromosome segregation ATPase